MSCWNFGEGLISSLEGGGNNLPINSFPWDKNDDTAKEDVGNTVKILPEKTEEVVAEADMDEAKTEEVVAEVVDGNEADRDEAMEVEGNEVVSDDAVGGNMEVEGNGVNSEEAVETY